MEHLVLLVCENNKKDGGGRKIHPSHCEREKEGGREGERERESKRERERERERGSSIILKKPLSLSVGGFSFNKRVSSLIQTAETT